MPARASAVCWASVPARPMGDMAPAIRNGVTITGCPASVYSSRAPSIRSSYRSGLLTLMRLITAGVSSILSRPPSRIDAISIVSRAF
jgi:hypothetical protein